MFFSWLILWLPVLTYLLVADRDLIEREFVLAGMMIADPVVENDLTKQLEGSRRWPNHEEGNCTCLDPYSIAVDLAEALDSALVVNSVPGKHLLDSLVVQANIEVAVFADLLRSSSKQSGHK